jgi:hypothetical protein
MSHFTVMIIGEKPEKQLKPFDENLQVPRYVENTKLQLIEKGKAEIERYKNEMYSKYLANPEEYKKNSNEGHFKYISTEFPLKLNWSDEEIYKDQIKYEEEENIGENGEVYSESNPNSKWDWYALGGRWAGLLKVNDGVICKEPSFSWGWSESDKKEVLDGKHTDQALKKDIANLDEVVTFALIKDGKWYERGEMGWWAIVSNEKDDETWAIEFKKLIKDLPDDTLISIYDCHI